MLIQYYHMEKFKLLNNKFTIKLIRDLEQDKQTGLTGLYIDNT